MKPQGREPCYIHADAWPSLEVFFSLLTQWNKLIAGGFSGPQELIPIGLRYETIEPTLRMLKVFVPIEKAKRLLDVTEWPDVFSDLQAMERELISRRGK